MTHIKDLMTRELQVIRPDASLHDAAKLMKDHDIGALPVITKEGRAVGIITDRDITVRGVANGFSHDVTVSDAMTEQIEFCYDDDTIDRLARNMGTKKLRRMIVVDRDTKGITGVVSLGDLASKGKDTKVAGAILAKCAA